MPIFLSTSTPPTTAIAEQQLDSSNVIDSTNHIELQGTRFPAASLSEEGVQNVETINTNSDSSVWHSQQSEGMLDSQQESGLIILPFTSTSTPISNLIPTHVSSYPPNFKAPSSTNSSCIRTSYTRYTYCTATIPTSTVDSFSLPSSPGKYF